MDSKSKAGDALKIFCQEFGVPERLTFDGSKEQTCKGTEFMSQVRKHGIDFHISEPDLHNQNPAEGCIREIRRKWYRVMIQKQVPEPFWDYGMRWVSDTSSMTYTTAGCLNDGTIPITDVTGETTDISEYLDFGFYDPVWYKDNAGLSPQQPGRWLGVSSRTGRLMCYHILTQKGTVISHSTVQRVTNLEQQTARVIDIYNKFDTAISTKLKLPTRGYHGDKPNPKDWADLLEEDEDFREEFEAVYNSDQVEEADDFTPEVLQDTYLGMDLALPRDGEGPEFAKVTKRLRDKEGLQSYDWFDFYRDAKEPIPPNMPEPRGLDALISCFVDANHAGNVKNRRSQTGILIFINKAPIHWYSKRQATVESSTFGAEFCAMRNATDLIESLQYKLRMFGVPIDGPANVYCDNEAVYKNTVLPESTLKKKHHSIAYHRCRQAVAAGVMRVAKQGTDKNLADLFTKVLSVARRTFLLERFSY